MPTSYSYGFVFRELPYVVGSFHNGDPNNILIWFLQDVIDTLRSGRLEEFRRALEEGRVHHVTEADEAEPDWEENILTLEDIIEGGKASDEFGFYNYLVNLDQNMVQVLGPIVDEATGTEYGRAEIPLDAEAIKRSIEIAKQKYPEEQGVGDAVALYWAKRTPGAQVRPVQTRTRTLRIPEPWEIMPPRRIVLSPVPRTGPTVALPTVTPVPVIPTPRVAISPRAGPTVVLPTPRVAIPKVVLPTIPTMATGIAPAPTIPVPKITPRITIPPRATVTPAQLTLARLPVTPGPVAPAGVWPATRPVPLLPKTFQAVEPDYNKMLVVQLKDELRKRGLPLTGNKADLIARLRQTPTDPQEAKNRQLYDAILAKNVRGVKEALKRGAAVNVLLGPYPELPLVLALRFFDENPEASEDILDELLAAGARDDLGDDQGRTVYDYTQRVPRLATKIRQAQRQRAPVTTVVPMAPMLTVPVQPQVPRAAQDYYVVLSYNDYRKNVVIQPLRIFKNEALALKYAEELADPANNPPNEYVGVEGQVIFDALAREETGGAYERIAVVKVPGGD